MCLECLDGAFGLVVAVVTGGYELVLHAVSRDAFLECVGCLVVEFVFSQSEVCSLHPVHHSLVCSHHFAFCSIFHRLNENIVCVEMDADHDVLVSSD